MHHAIASKDFSRKTLSQLARKGIAVTGAAFAPGPDGSFANGERVYILVIDGCQYIRTHAQVLVCAASSWRGDVTDANSVAANEVIDGRW
jgi:hypothetical protein